MKDNKKDQNMVRYTLFCVLDIWLRLTYPLMPFITEELRQRVMKERYGHQYRIGDKSIMIQQYPKINESRDDMIEDGMILFDHKNKVYLVLAEERNSINYVLRQGMRIKRNK